MNHSYWKSLLVFALLVTFIGGAFKVMFSPPRLRNYINGIIFKKQPKFNIDFVESELRLWENWRPTLAIEMRNINVRSNDTCMTNSVIQIDRLLVPMSIASFLSEEIVFGHVKAASVRYFMRPSSCSDKRDDVEKVAGLDNFERFFRTRWSKEVINTTRYLKEFTVNTFELLRDDQALAPMIIEDFNMVFKANKGESIAKFFVKVGYPWAGKTQLGRIGFKAVIKSDEVYLSGKGNLKEGQYNAITRWAVDRGDISVKLNTRDLPVQQVLNLAHHWNLVSGFNPDIKNQWMSCDMTLDGEIRLFLKTPIFLHQCRLYGDLGEIALKTKEVKNLDNKLNIAFEIQQLKISQLLASFNIKKIWSVIGRSGILSGHFSFTNQDTYKFEGVVRDIEVNAGEININARQLVDEIRVSVAGTSSGFSGELSDFQIKNGSGLGLIKFNSKLNNDFQLNYDFSNLMFSPDFQNLALNASVQPLKTKGEIFLQDGHLQRLNSDIDINQIQNLNWELSRVKVKINFKDDQLVLFSQAHKFFIRPESRWAVIINTLFNELAQKPKELALYSLSNQSAYNLSDKKWTFSDSSLRTTQPHIRFNLNGTYDVNSGLQGIIYRSKPSSQKWSIYGSFSQPEIKVMDAQ